jgi:uncharacterized membrane protein
VIKPATTLTTEIDVADIEHVGAMIAGVALLSAGVRRGGLSGTILNIAGLAFIYRGQQGYRPLYRALGLNLPDEPTGIGKQNDGAAAEIKIARSPKELYLIWRNLENLPVIMDHLISVKEIDDLRSVWVAKGPLGTVVKWDARIINDIPYELIAWETLEGSGVDHAGSVHFDDIGNGHTNVRIKLRYDPPADQLGIWIGQTLQIDPQKQIERSLLRFKEIMEVGNAKAVAHVTA